MVTQINGSVVKAFDILKLFDEDRNEVTTTDVATELDLNFVTAHRFLRTLEHVGALVAVAKGRYRLSYVFVDLGDRVTGGDLLGQTLQPLLNAITADLQEAAMATVFQSDMVVCIARAVSRRQLSVDIRVGSRLEAYCTAHGKTWLAFMSERQRAHYLDTVERLRFTRNTVVERATLERQIAEVRELGHAFNDSEREDGIRAVAVPILARGGRMIAGLSVFGPASRMTDEITQLALARLQHAARDAGGLLYGQIAAPSA
ncbi:IclR family transcriptional regulator [Mesorhizobium sp. CGMCC 1.15528]|uniref:IclR family transcriptional regulator n=1 Tax=Mesorhizobium zhangyense TaxID=1776730 RepID=A0A7C9V8C6_9HYPH|nr:IclR family transcriptional regulator [Mesorhizobium zhangyense]NGN41146.1 IclR family transcriptional regulator [Mesorhizobium zhangyense]